MSPPEVWGPAVWSLFHTLAERVNAHIYPYIARQMFKMIVRICGFLPCPECSTDASNFLAKIKIENLKTKEDFKQTFYLFHNYVNAKKRKPLFNYSNLAVYQRYMLIPIVNNFIISYNTKGNMKMINESFQRQFVLKEFKNWFTANIKAFMSPVHPPAPIHNPVNIVPIHTTVVSVEEEQVVSNEEHAVSIEEEKVVSSVEEEPVVSSEEEQVVSEEEHVVSVEEEQFVSNEEEQFVSNEEEHVVSVEEEQVVSNEEQFVEDQSIVEESIEEEHAVSTKSTNKKKNKKIKNKLNATN